MRNSCDKTFSSEGTTTQIQCPCSSIVKSLHRNLSHSSNNLPGQPDTRVPWIHLWQSLSFITHPPPLPWSWAERWGNRAPLETGGLEDLSWEIQTYPTTGQRHGGNPKGELTCERSRILCREGGKKLLALCQTKNELFWPLYCGGYPMTIQYFHPRQRHVFWERFTMLAWAVLHKLILQWKHTSATRIQWNCIIISVFSFQRLSDKPKL